MSQWQPTISNVNLRKRAAIISQIRNFFSARNVLEVETPQLANHGVSDPHLNCFTSQYSDSSKGDTRLFLQTSPEYAMKRLIAAGSGDIYQICKAYRHEASGRHHNPEFTMLEWYRLDFDMQQLVVEVGDLLSIVLDTANFEQATYQDLFIRFFQIDPLTCTHDELKQKIQQSDLAMDWVEREPNFDTLLQYVFSIAIEPKIGQIKPIAVTHFPSSQASLATTCQHDPRVANRFEFYFKGIELANGFEELTDGTEQLARFKRDNAIRLQIGQPQISIDQHFIAALNSGLPACSGVALGIDRLVMLALKQEKIADVITFPIDSA